MGVAALGDGQIEYMMLRFLNSTDDQGPWPLNDQGPVQVRLQLQRCPCNSILFQIPMS
jgi:hypothetical protein